MSLASRELERYHHHYQQYNMERAKCHGQRTLFFSGVAAHDDTDALYPRANITDAQLQILLDELQELRQKYNFSVCSEEIGILAGAEGLGLIIIIIISKKYGL